MVEERTERPTEDEIAQNGESPHLSQSFAPLVGRAKEGGLGTVQVEVADEMEVVLCLRCTPRPRSAPVFEGCGGGEGGGRPKTRKAK